jgi:hypothetical protein
MQDPVLELIENLLKRQCHEIFDLWFFHKTIQSRSLIHAIKYLRISL